MNEELNEILKFYEEEKENLESLIANNVEAGEYKVAHLNRKALFKVNHTLLLLRNLANPDYTEIEQLEFRIHNFSSTRYQRLCEDNAILKDYVETEKNHLEQKLKSLRGKSIPYQIDKQDFDDVIVKLVEGKIKGFKFFINLEKQLCLAFKKRDHQLIISLLNFKKLKKSFILHKHNINAIKKIGFQLSENKKRFHYFYDLNNFKDSIDIKMITSRVIYDGFEYHNLENSSIIVIID